MRAIVHTMQVLVVVLFVLQIIATEPGDVTYLQLLL